MSGRILTYRRKPTVMEAHQVFLETVLDDETNYRANAGDFVVNTGDGLIAYSPMEFRERFEQVYVAEHGEVNLNQALIDLGIAESNSGAERLLSAQIVELDGSTLPKPTADEPLRVGIYSDTVLTVGRHRIILVPSQRA